MLALPPADTAILILIRHGATAANMQRPYILQGRGLNGPLNATGERQVQAARDFLSTFPLNHVYASPMLRAQQSAEVIAAPHGLKVQTIPELIEVNVGEWEGLSWEQISQRDPDYHQQFLANPAEVPYKGGECYRDVRNRVCPAFRQLASLHLGKMVAVVAHNVVNRSLLADTLGLDLNLAKELKQDNACINIFRFQADVLSLITMNGIFHLGEVTSG